MTGAFDQLPYDILILILPLLDAQSFLNLCRTCKDLAHLRFDTRYWSHATRSTFRLRNRPAVQRDGQQWQRLYKRLLTQSRVYTWGQNKNGCLGRNPPPDPSDAGMGRLHFRGRRARSLATDFNERVSWPGEMEMPEGFGVIADLQCGGWSTSLLNDKGVILTAGILNENSYTGADSFALKVMKYPPGFSGEEGHKEAVAIRQFSSGRTHILGLSDNGLLWSWHDNELPGVRIGFEGMSTAEESNRNTGKNSQGKIRYVVAGWSKSSALIEGTGIVLWDTFTGRGLTAEEAALDNAKIKNWTAVPKSYYQRPKGQEREPDEITRVLGKEIGKVTTHIVLEHYVVFATDVSKVFAARIEWNQYSGNIRDPFELSELQALSETDNSPSVTDVQGSFRSFAVFKRNGVVITTDQDYLDAYARRLSTDSQYPLPPIEKIPALQQTGVTSVAFGDYHYHALHSDGSISSYGREPASCGALGLGGSMGVPISMGMLRGIHYNPWNRDGTLLPHGYFRGRKIWFHPESERWIRNLAGSGSVEAKESVEAAERVRMVSSMPPVQGEIGEWVEQMGRDWDRLPEVAARDEDGLGAYFALSVAAAGWHSGALILVNDELVDAVSDACAENIPEPLQNGRGPDMNFPRLRLESGEDMPGVIPFSRWKEPKPDWKLNWRGTDYSGKVFGVEGWERLP